jgi:hypothetical protein
LSTRSKQIANCGWTKIEINSFGFETSRRTRRSMHLLILFQVTGPIFYVDGPKIPCQPDFWPANFARRARAQARQPENEREKLTANSYRVPSPDRCAQDGQQGLAQNQNAKPNTILRHGTKHHPRSSYRIVIFNFGGCSDDNNKRQTAGTA